MLKKIEHLFLGKKYWSKLHHTFVQLYRYIYWLWKKRKVSKMWEKHSAPTLLVGKFVFDLGWFSLPPPGCGVILSPVGGENLHQKAAKRYFVKLRTNWNLFYLSILTPLAMLFLTPGWPKKKTHRHRSPFQARFCQWCQEASKARQKAAEAAQSQGVRVSQRSGLQPQFRVSCVSSWPCCMKASEMDVFFFKWDFGSQLKM